MTEDHFDKLIKNAADHYNVPPVNPPLTEMWAAIETEAFGRRLEIQPARRSLMANPWLRMAAVLVLGVAIGRGSRLIGPQAPAPTQNGPVVQVADAASSYELTTERYLVQTVALLVGLPRQLQAGRVDSTFIARASGSLTTLRLLMDSPAANNPRMRALFEDLELVLVQVVQMPETGNASDAKLIRQAMQERDVMPRLRDAVAETPN
jgi:hypothetical protein